MVVKKKKFKKTICFDIDGVICETYKNDYENAKPIIKSVNTNDKTTTGMNLIPNAAGI